MGQKTRMRFRTVAEQSVFLYHTTFHLVLTSIIALNCTSALASVNAVFKSLHLNCCVYHKFSIIYYKSSIIDVARKAVSSQGGRIYRLMASSVSRNNQSGKRLSCERCSWLVSFQRFRQRIFVYNSFHDTQFTRACLHIVRESHLPFMFLQRCLVQISLLVAASA